jgi:RND family efflux transporter MFP subunit
MTQTATQSAWGRVVAILTRTAVGLALLAGAVLAFAYLVKTRPIVEPAERESVPAVGTLPAPRMEVQRRWTGFGTARAMDEADVSARVSATVVERPAGILAGARVESGQILVRLDESDFASAVEISTQTIADLTAQLQRIDIEERSWGRRLELARRQVELAEAEETRVLEALGEGAARERELDAARAALLRAQQEEVAVREQFDGLAPRRAGLAAQRLAQEAALRLAEENRRRCTIRSPIPGVLSAVDMEVGESVAVGQRVAHVVSLRRMEVPLRLPASARPQVSAGDAVTLRGSGPAGATWRARVSRIGPEDDALTRTMSVYVEVEQEEGEALLAPGTFVEGAVLAGPATHHWVVPRRAVRDDRVLLVRDGRLVSRPVEVLFHVERSEPQLGVTDTQWVVLAPQALAAGDQVVVNAARGLAEGAAVRAVPVNALAAGPPAGPGRAAEASP